MIANKVQKAINDQINAELYSAYLYLAMSAYFQSVNLQGFANWMRVQYQEETLHALKFYDYLVERSGRVMLQPIAPPPPKWASPLAVFEESYAHERKVTALINKIADLAIAEGDHATVAMLQWFVTEQVEEEASAEKIVEELKRIGDNSGALFMLDRELLTRVFTPPPATAA